MHMYSLVNSATYSNVQKQAILKVKINPQTSKMGKEEGGDVQKQKSSNASLGTNPSDTPQAC